MLLPAQLNKVITVDTDPDFPYALVNQQYVNDAVLLSTVRADWLKFATGTNTLTYTADQTGDITITARWRTRFNFK
jgi:hypothetical protein